MAYKMLYLARRNPAIALADWPRAWRSHAVFASQFPVLGASIDSLFYCSRVDAPAIAGVSQDYDGVAIVASPSRAALAGEMSAADRARLDVDELRVFDAPTPGFTFHTEEVLAHGGAPASVAVLRFLARRSGIGIAAFEAHLGDVRAAIRGRDVVRYAWNRPIAAMPPGYPFDGITETWFAGPDDGISSLADAAPAFSEICDTARSVTLLAQVIHRWPRA